MQAFDPGAFSHNQPSLPGVPLPAPNHRPGYALQNPDDNRNGSHDMYSITLH